MARAIDVHIVVQDDEIGANVLGFVSIGLSQVGGLRMSTAPLECADVTMVLSYRVLPDSLAHLSRPGKQPVLPATIRPGSARARRPSQGQNTARALPPSSAHRYRLPAEEDAGNGSELRQCAVSSISAQELTRGHRIESPSTAAQVGNIQQFVHASRK